MSKLIIGEDNPALAFISNANKSQEQTEQPVKATAKAKKKPIAKDNNKKDYRINLALTHSIGEQVKEQAWKNRMSVNAYIESIIVKELNN